jgi:hypothetical protein
MHIDRNTSPAATMAAADPDRLGLLIMIGIGMAGLILCQFIDVMLTGGGLLLLNVAVPLPVLGQHGFAYLLAIVFVLAQLGAGLVVVGVGGMLGRIRRAARPFVILLLVVVITVNAAFHFTQLTNMRSGEALLKGLVQDGRGLWTRLAAADAAIAADYREAVAQAAARADDAAHGRDPSGDARCGTLCLAEKNRKRRLQQEFGPLGTTVLSDWSVGDTGATLAAVQGGIDRLRPRVAMWQRMCAMLERPCADPLVALAADPAMTRLQAALGAGMATSQTSLVMGQVSHSLATVLTGEATFEVYVLLMVSTVPALAESVFLTILLAALRRPSDGERLARLREMDASLSEELRLRTQINAKASFRDEVLKATHA